jgi:raffinose/stachyose/melibiose transport system substrate-binding protein
MRVARAVPRYRKVGVALVLAAFLSLAVSACGTPGNSGGTSSGSTEAVSTKVTKEPVTLKVLDTGTEPGTNNEYNALNELFEKKYPNVKVERSPEPFESFLSNVKLRLSSNEAPDISEGNPGAQIDGTLVKGDLIRPLDGYAQAYGWSKIWSTKTQATNMYSADGENFGEGKLFGISPRGEVVGVFYNKEKLKELGFDVPSTFAEFEEILAAAKEAGETPLMVGEGDGYPGDHAFMTLADHYENAEKLREWIFGRPGSTVETKPMEAAAAKLQEWAKEDYFEEGFLGVKDSEAQPRFGEGGAVFTIGVSVLNGGLAEKLHDGVGYFLMPPEKAGDPTYSTGSLSPGMHITTASKVPNVAAAWLNMLASQEGAEVVLESGDVPAFPIEDPKGVDPKSSLASILDAWKTQSQAGRLVPYMDAATATMYDTLTADVQDLMGGQTTPSAFVKVLQEDWNKAHGGAK